ARERACFAWAVRILSAKAENTPPNRYDHPRHRGQRPDGGVWSSVRLSKTVPLLRSPETP
ncbi:hypothetical protein, partial [Mesorhizobium sp.]|uniref:hypothetical protein n=1 Tax=Mesorhizobium sp. TaxID=1871066 RepID=UPI0025D699AA